MSARARLRKVLWKWVAPVAGLAALGLALFLFFHEPADKSYRLRGTAGSPCMFGAFP